MRVRCPLLILAGSMALLLAGSAEAQVSAPTLRSPNRQLVMEFVIQPSTTVS